jgi:hypothetical protein
MVGKNGSKNAISLSGFRLVDKKREIPAFEVLSGGIYLRAIDEYGKQHDPEKVMVLLALTEFENGMEKIAVPYQAPAVLDSLAKKLGTKILRIGRDGKEADELYSEQTFMHDGIFAAIRICTRLADSERNTPFHFLLEYPNFHVFPGIFF